jgi:hypothetical protein
MNALTRMSLTVLLGFPALYADEDNAKIKRVLLISIDGMHALDLANYVTANPHSRLAQLSAAGVTYTNASTTKPSDSFPAMVGIVTGGTPAVTGIYYDDAYNRKLSPPGSACAKIGTVIDLKEGIDRDPAALDAGGGLDPAKLPLDPSKGCTPVFPHDMLRVNTIFEVIKAAHLHTAYSEKRPSYDILHGPSGKGVDDLYTPEIAFDNTLKSLAKGKTFDDLRVTSILNEIDGKDHTGKADAPVPAIFGMNFQCINIAKKVAPGAYTDSFSTPTTSLLGALNYIDESIGKMIDELEVKHLTRSTAIVITAKHGETAVDPARRTIVSTGVIPAIVNGVQANLVARATQKSNALLWLTDQSKTGAAVQALAASQTAGVGQILAGESLKLLFPDPAVDPATPDIIVVSNTGVNYEPSGSTTLAEHGGLGENDSHVPIIVSFPGIEPGLVRAPVTTTQIAPTILQLLKLNPASLEAVQLEKTAVLPGLNLKGGVHDE